MSAPLRIGIVGIGDYAAAHHHAVLKLEEKRCVRLVCTCDPQKDSFTAQQAAWRFRERGVFVFADYSAMLAACAPHLDILVVAAPLPMRAEIHRAALEAGLAVYLEKPPTLEFRELEQMIARDRLARRKTLVGFSFLTEKTRLSLKTRLLQGEFGALKSVALFAVRSRPTSYFHRCASAGRVHSGDCLVLDSPLSNELAHFVQACLFWAGSAELFNAPEIATVRAELYRAHLIESADTALIETTTTRGVPIRLAVSQAHAGASSHKEVLHCERATIEYVVGQGASIRHHAGTSETLALDTHDPLIENHLGYLRYCAGEVERPVITLEDSRAFVALNTLAFISSGEITPIPAEELSLVCNPKDQKDYVSVQDLEATLLRFVERGVWPGERQWLRSCPSRTVQSGEIGEIDAVVKNLCDPTPRAKAG